MPIVFLIALFSTILLVRVIFDPEKDMLEHSHFYPDGKMSPSGYLKIQRNMRKVV